MATSTRTAASGDATARRGRPPGDHEAKRRELLKAATSVIAEEGLANTSLRRVAQRAGCTTGAVTYYFADKEELVSSVADIGFDRFDTMLTAARDEADIRKVFERWFARGATDHFWPVMFQILAHARHDPALADVIAERYARYRAVHAEILADGQAQGTVRDDIPADVLADQLSAMGDGWMMMLPIEPKRFTKHRLKALLDATMMLISPPTAPAR
jgi:TetR/AcrR family transcriptional regulator, transcriptional repressor of aconitase